MIRICSIALLVGLVGCVTEAGDETVEETSASLETGVEVGDVEPLASAMPDQAYEVPLDEGGGGECTLQFYCMTKTSTGICIRYGYCLGSNGACSDLCGALLE